VIAEEMFGQQIPVLRVDTGTLSRLASIETVTIRDGSITDGDGFSGPHTRDNTNRVEVELSPLDEQFLDGAFGEAAQIATR
jgi:hypothetical protein